MAIDATLAVYEAVLAQHPRTGICLQAYLRRTVMDATKLVGLGASIRLVKGAYDEPKGVAFRTRSRKTAPFDASRTALVATSRIWPGRWPSGEWIQLPQPGSIVLFL